MLDPPGRVLGGRTDDVLSYDDGKVFSEEGLDAEMALLVRVVKRRLSWVVITLRIVSPVEGHPMVRAHHRNDAILFVEIRAGTVLKKHTNKRRLFIHIPKKTGPVTARFVEWCSIARTHEMNVGTPLQEQAH